MPSRSMMRWSALLAALLCAAGCSTVSKWKQEHRAARLHHAEEQEAADAHAEPPAYLDMKRRMAQQDARLRKLQATLAERSDADSLAAAALLERAILGYSSPTAQQLAARAVAAAPTRADLAFVRLQLCETSAQCEPAPLETQQLQLDPENGVVWVYVLRRADLAQDSAARATAFYALARARRIDLYWNRIVAHLAASARNAGFDSGAALAQVISIESTFALDYDPITRLCLVPQLQPEMLAACRQIAAAFRAADTAVVEAYGSSLALNLWPGNSPERAAVIAERRALRYRVELMDRNRARLNSEQATRILAGLVGQYPTEQAAYRAFYLRLGLNPDPPAGWKDPAPGG